MPSLARRPGSHDLEYRSGEFTYLDSYFGGSDFIGQEVVYARESPVWAMNYYGRVLDPDRITAAEAGQVIKASLSILYAEGRFLGGFRCEVLGCSYHDTNVGSFTAFTGKEWIEREGVMVYELFYHGGLLK
ncbi:MAG: hypothetical protein JXB35_00930 [Anaerolineae bacterium]|nr:hypothetical protein [Anaerolineae bacterium]